jgi:hypothetical protein
VDRDDGPARPRARHPVRSWIGRRTGELPPGFATAVRDWLLVLPDGDARSRPRSATTIYVYFTAVQPLINRWSADRGHLREVTAEDIRGGLDKLRGHPLHTTISAAVRCSGSPGNAA